MKRRICKRPYKCSVCKADGHNKKGCPLGKEQYWIEVKGEGSHGAIPSKCSLCMKTGHNKSGCSLEKKMVPASTAFEVLLTDCDMVLRDLSDALNDGEENSSVAGNEVDNPQPPPGEMQIVVHAGTDKVGHNAACAEIGTASNLEENQQCAKHPKVRKSRRIQWNKWIAPKKIDTTIIDLTED